MGQIETERPIVLDLSYQHQISLERQILSYAANPLFANGKSWIIEDNPFRRPVRPQDFNNFSFTVPLDRAAFCSGSALAAQRMLLNIYESDFMLLPEHNFPAVKKDFRLFYSPQSRFSGEQIRATLERHVFDFLDTEIDASGNWSQTDMIAFFDLRLGALAESESAVSRAVLSARNPQEAATTFLVQLACDFLTEASAMARNVLGSYGPALSELFKVLIDEYGYGVHQVKHSTLFQRTLLSRGLSPRVHAYWPFYPASSLALTNYFHYVSKNHENFFRYLGALYYTEASLVYATRHHSKMLRAIWGDQVDTKYFDEHTHIDQHHGRLVIDNIIKPLVEQCGKAIIPEIVRGFEEFHLLQKLADEDLIAQIAWSDQRETYKERAREVFARVNAGQLDCPTESFDEPQGELSTTHVHEFEELLVVEDGTLEFVTGHDQYITLGCGEGIIIPRHRLHGSVVVSPRCAYQVFTIGD